MRQLSNGVRVDLLTEYGRLAESKNLQSLRKFTIGVVHQFKAEWLHLPTAEDAKEIEHYYRQLGFSDCLGCVDCASWEWDACPVGWQGLRRGMDKKPVTRVEAIYDDFLRIWWINFGAPG
jgi:hypothetical protein